MNCACCDTQIISRPIYGARWMLYFCGDCEKAIRKINTSAFNAQLTFYIKESDEEIFYIEGYPGPRLPKQQFEFKKYDILLIKEIEKFME